MISDSCRGFFRVLISSGRWAGRDVAIKVIEHDTLSAPAVVSEQ